MITEEANSVDQENYLDQITFGDLVCFMDAESVIKKQLNENAEFELKNFDKPMVPYDQ